ncbi:hypothetical protein Vafri_8354, partial [Volvox africanus]
DSLKRLTPQNAIDFLNTAFDELSLAEAADKGHQLDEAISHYDAFLERINLFLTSSICELYAGEVNPGDLRAIMPGVRVRLDRLNNLRAIRNKPPIPGAIPLTGPGAAASVAPEAAQALADIAAQGSSVAATEGAVHEAAQRLAAELQRVAVEQLSISGESLVNTDSGNPEQARTSGRGATAAAAAAAGTAPPPFRPLAQQCCANCGTLGQWGSGCSRGPRDIQTAAQPLVAEANMPTAAASMDATLVEFAPASVSPAYSAGVSASAPVSLEPGAVGSVLNAITAPNSDSAWSDGQSGAGIGGEAAVILDPSPSLLRCSRCRKVLYCSARCQRAHWPQHKPLCCN